MTAEAQQETKTGIKLVPLEVQDLANECSGVELATIADACTETFPFAELAKKLKALPNPELHLAAKLAEVSHRGLELGVELELRASVKETIWFLQKETNGVVTIYYFIASSGKEIAERIEAAKDSMVQLKEILTPLSERYNPAMLRLCLDQVLATAALTGPEPPR